MSVLTKALSPWENELSQMLGAAHHLIRSPRDGVVLERVTELVDELEELLDGFDLEVLDSYNLVTFQLDRWRAVNERQFWLLKDGGWL